MLVLSRKVGEQIRIGDEITVTVERLTGNRVSLSFEAPRTTKIVRGELLERRDEESDPKTEAA